MTAWGRVAALVLLVAGCAAPEPMPPSQSASPAQSQSPSMEPGVSTGSPSATAAGGPDLPGLLVCEDSDFAVPANVLRGPAEAELAPDGPAAALREFVATPEAASLELPMSGWRRVAESPDSVTFLAHGPSDWVTATVTPTGDGTWQFWEGGVCAIRIRLPDDIGFAEWRVDPAAPPHPGDQALTLLVTETACASGRPPAGRLLPPVVLVAPDAITIAIAVGKLPGGQDCPGNPEARMTVNLPEAIGNRRLFDGSSFPAAPRT